MCPGPLLIFYTSPQPANKKGGAVKSGVSKKGEAAGQLKTSKAVEPEDVEVNSLYVFFSYLIFAFSLYDFNDRKLNIILHLGVFAAS